VCHFRYGFDLMLCVVPKLRHVCFYFSLLMMHAVVQLNRVQLMMVVNA